MTNKITVEVEWTLARRVYAAAHDMEPRQVDATDGSYVEVAELLAKDDWDRSEILARALGLPDDTEWGEILAQIERLRAERDEIDRLEHDERRAAELTVPPRALRTQDGRWPQRTRGSAPALGASAPEHVNAARAIAERICPGDSIDLGIARALDILITHGEPLGIKTNESCDGSPGHSYFEPTIAFVGSTGAAWHAVGICLDHGLPLRRLCRSWTFDTVGLDGDPATWELIFWPSVREGLVTPPRAVRDEVTALKGGR